MHNTQLTVAPTYPSSPKLNENYQRALRSLLIGCVLLSALASNAYSAGLKEELIVCRDLPSRLERLDCYDTLADALRDGNFVTLKVEDLAKSDARATSSTSNREFGRRGKDQKERLRSVIASTVKVARGRFKITLADGQVWREVEPSRRSDANFKVGEAVTIKKTFLGAYLITVNDSGYSRKVQRVQ